MIWESCHELKSYMECHWIIKYPDHTSHIYSLFPLYHCIATGGDLTFDTTANAVIWAPIRWSGMRTFYLDQSCISQFFFSFCPLSLDLRNVLKEGLLSPLNGASLLQQKFLLLFLFKLSCLCQHCFLFFCNLYSFVSIEQNPFSPRFSAITTLTITVIILMRSPVKHVIGIGPVQLAAGG